MVTGPRFASWLTNHVIVLVVLFVDATKHSQRLVGFLTGQSMPLPHVLPEFRSSVDGDNGCRHDRLNQGTGATRSAAISQSENRIREWERRRVVCGVVVVLDVCEVTIVATEPNDHVIHIQIVSRDP